MVTIISYVRACSRTEEGKSAMTCRFEIDSLRRAPYVWFAKFYSCWWQLLFHQGIYSNDGSSSLSPLVRLRLLPVDLECNNTACMATEGELLGFDRAPHTYVRTRPFFLFPSARVTFKPLPKSIYLALHTIHSDPYASE